MYNIISPLDNHEHPAHQLIKCVCNQTAAVSNRFRLMSDAHSSSSSHMVSRFLQGLIRTHFLSSCVKIDIRKNKRKRKKMYIKIRHLTSFGSIRKLLLYRDDGTEAIEITINKYLLCIYIYPPL